MGRLDFKQILLVLLLSYGLLWALSALSVLDIIVNFFKGFIPFDFTIGTIQGITIPPLAGLIAIVVVAFLVTLLAVSISEGFENKKLWGTFVILSIVSAFLWIAVPQILPSGIFQAAAGSAQSLATGSLPQSLLMP